MNEASVKSDLFLATTPLDIIRLIAENDENAWIHAAIYHPGFGNYARTEIGRNKFIELFTVISYDEDNIYVIQTWKLLRWQHVICTTKYEDAEYNLSLLESRDVNGAIIHKYYQNNVLHREDDLPAVIGWYKNNINDQPMIEIWYINGILSRADDKPARVMYYYNGSKRSEQWYDQGGLLHRDIGYAEAAYSLGGRIISKKYCKHGTEYRWI